MAVLLLLSMADHAGMLLLRLLLLTIRHNAVGRSRMRTETGMLLLLLVGGRLVVLALWMLLHGWMRRMHATVLQPRLGILLLLLLLCMTADHTDAAHPANTEMRRLHANAAQSGMLRLRLLIGVARMLLLLLRLETRCAAGIGQMLLVAGGEARLLVLADANADTVTTDAVDVLGRTSGLLVLHRCGARVRSVRLAGRLRLGGPRIQRMASDRR